jgi:hypothetical protein
MVSIIGLATPSINKRREPPSAHYPDDTYMYQVPCVTLRLVLQGASSSICHCRGGWFPLLLLVVLRCLLFALSEAWCSWAIQEMKMRRKLALMSIETVHESSVPTSRLGACKCVYSLYSCYVFGRSRDQISAHTGCPVCGLSCFSQTFHGIHKTVI